MRTIVVAFAVLLLAAPAWAQTPRQRADAEDAEKLARLARIPWPKDPHKRLKELDGYLGTDPNETTRHAAQLQSWGASASTASGKARSRIMDARALGGPQRIPLLAVYYPLYYFRRLEAWYADRCFKQLLLYSIERKMLRGKLFPKVPQ